MPETLQVRPNVSVYPMVVLPLMLAEDGAEGDNKQHVMIVLEYTNTMQTQYCVHVCTSTGHSTKWNISSYIV